MSEAAEAAPVRKRKRGPGRPRKRRTARRRDVVTSVSTDTPSAAAAAAAPPGGAGAGDALPSSAQARAREPRAKPKRMLVSALVVEQWPIGRLVEYGRNPRNNDGEVGRMVDLLCEYGFRIPIVARSDGTIVDGHLRYKAAKQLKLETVPVALADSLSDAQVRAFRLAANKSAEWATWNTELVRLEIEDLREDKFSLALTGFEPTELAVLLDEPLATLAPPKRPAAKSVACPNCNHVFSP